MGASPLSRLKQGGNPPPPTRWLQTIDGYGIPAHPKPWEMEISIEKKIKRLQSLEICLASTQPSLFPSTPPWRLFRDDHPACPESWSQKHCLATKWHTVAGCTNLGSCCRGFIYAACYKMLVNSFLHSVCVSDSYPDGHSGLVEKKLTGISASLSNDRLPIILFNSQRGEFWWYQLSRGNTCLGHHYFCCWIHIYDTKTGLLGDSPKPPPTLGILHGRHATLEHVRVLII